MAETGSILWLYGGVSDTNVSQNGSLVSYPNAQYLLDGIPGEVTSRLPSVDNLLGSPLQSVPSDPTEIQPEESFTSRHRISNTALIRSTSQ